MANDGVQPKTPPLSTRHLICVDYKVVSRLYQLIFLSFSCLNIARQNTVIELCRALILFVLLLFSKLTFSFVAIEV